MKYLKLFESKIINLTSRNAQSEITQLLTKLNISYTSGAYKDCIVWGEKMVNFD
jgi:hypothetical protein